MLDRFACRLLLAALFLSVSSWTASAQDRSGPEVLLRVDDIGMNHAVNMAMKELAEADIPLSASVMFATPWYQEAVEILKEHPQVSVGVHLTLNSEWKGYRWGPVLGREAVPSLVDSVGYFHPSVAAFLNADYDLDEVERELSAQVERALDSGLDIDYVDYHMGTAAATPELRAVVERIAEKYGLGISRYFGERSESLWATPVEEKQEAFFDHLDGLAPDSTNLIVFHIAHDTPEMQLVDMNAPEQNTEDEEPLVGKHRQAELDALLSDEFARKVREQGLRLITYADLIEGKGLDAMQPPEE